MSWKKTSLRKDCVDSDEYRSISSVTRESSSGYASVSVASFDRSSDEIDLCAICYSSKGNVTFATHFCEECGLLGHFLCETCLTYHKQFTKHTNVKSLLAAKYKTRSISADELKVKTEEITCLKNNLTAAEREVDSLVRAKGTLERDIQKLLEELEGSKHSGQTITGAIGLRGQLKKAQVEIDELKHRLSNVVGANNMVDNLTDLSDENKPTKLSEIFTELYDNEWTDAFEEAENEFKTEEKGIDHLYKTLLDVFDFCKKKSVEHAQNIRNCVTTLPNSPNGRPKPAEIGVTNLRQLKEIRKSFAPMLVDSVFQNYFKEKKLNLSKKNNTERFIRKCVEICWLMNSQDPPVILDITVVTGKSFDSDKFRTYTKTGKVVDFVVWPPMLLHKDGPMLCKGVAQGK